MENRARPRRTQNFITDSFLDRKVYFNPGFANSLLSKLTIKGGGPKHKKETSHQYNHVALKILLSAFDDQLASLAARVVYEFGPAGLDQILETQQTQFDRLHAEIKDFVDSVKTTEVDLIEFIPFVSSKKSVVYINADVNQANEELLEQLGLKIVPQRKKDVIETLQMQNYLIERTIDSWWYGIYAQKS